MRGTSRRRSDFLDFYIREWDKVLLDRCEGLALRRVLEEEIPITKRGMILSLYFLEEQVIESIRN